MGPPESPWQLSLPDMGSMRPVLGYWGTQLCTVLPGTQHAVRDHEGVLDPARLVRHHRHVHLHQLHGAAGSAWLWKLYCHFKIYLDVECVIE